MTEHIQRGKLFTVVVKSISLPHSDGKSDITLSSDGSTIRIPLDAHDGGFVPHDAEGHWATLHGRYCLFEVGVLQNWLQGRYVYNKRAP